MKKNYTLKLVLAMLVVVLVSLVSFVGVYKGKNLLKEYSFGKDFEQRKVFIFSGEVIEEEKKEEKTEESSNENNGEENASQEENKNEDTEISEEEKAEKNKKSFKEAKNIIAKRLTAMKSEEYDIRLDEKTGKLVIEVPSDIDSSYISEIVTVGKVQIINESNKDVIVDTNGFKSASAAYDTTSTTKPIVAFNVKFSKDGKKVLKECNKMDTDDEGNQTESTFAFVIDGQTLYSAKASSFAEAAEKGELELMLGQNDEGIELEKDYQEALAITAIIKSGKIPVNYEIEDLKYVNSNISIKTIVIISIIVGACLLLFATYKFKVKGALSVLSLVGLLASILLVLRYTNVKITLFTVLGLAIVMLFNYIFVIKNLNSGKKYKEDLVELLNILIPCIIVAIIFCCAPYLQLASFGMAIFWGILVTCIYDTIITKIFLDK